MCKVDSSVVSRCILDIVAEGIILSTIDEWVD